LPGSILGFGAVWYQGFKIYGRRRTCQGHVEFQVQKVSELDRVPLLNRPSVQVHETVFLAWVAKENHSMDLEMEERVSVEYFQWL
jgi:hypothetical protein